jgi:hypothetical protein
MAMSVARFSEWKLPIDLYPATAAPADGVPVARDEAERWRPILLLAHVVNQKLALIPISLLLDILLAFTGSMSLRGY